MIETLFICNPANAPANEAARRPVLPTPKAENKVLDPKKAQNIAILLRALNVTKEEVCDALCEGDSLAVSWCSLTAAMLVRIRIVWLAF